LPIARGSFGVRLASRTSGSFSEAAGADGDCPPDAVADDDLAVSFGRLAMKATAANRTATTAITTGTTGEERGEVLATMTCFPSDVVRNV
jgi:hypothetical protein